MCAYTFFFENKKIKCSYKVIFAEGVSHTRSAYVSFFFPYWLSDFRFALPVLWGEAELKVLCIEHYVGQSRYVDNESKGNIVWWLYLQGHSYAMLTEAAS